MLWSWGWGWGGVAVGRVLGIASLASAPALLTLLPQFFSSAQGSDSHASPAKVATRIK